MVLPFQAVFPASIQPVIAVSIAVKRMGKYNTSFLPSLFSYILHFLFSPPFSSGLLSVCEGSVKRGDKTPRWLVGCHCCDPPGPLLLGERVTYGDTSRDGCLSVRVCA